MDIIIEFRAKKTSVIVYEVGFTTLTIHFKAFPVDGPRSCCDGSLRLLVMAPLAADSPRPFNGHPATRTAVDTMAPVR